MREKGFEAPWNTGDVAEWLASQPPVNRQQFCFPRRALQAGEKPVAGYGSLMPLTAAQEAQNWVPDVERQPCRVLARDTKHAEAGAWVLDGVELITLPVLWAGLGAKYAAEDLYDWYCTLRVYATKHDRVQDAKKKRQRVETEEKEEQARLSVDAAAYLCKQHGIDEDDD